ITQDLENDMPLLRKDKHSGELDIIKARIVTDLLVKENRELGKTVIMVTHDQNVARVADNIMRIEDGTIKASLTPSQIAGPEVSTSYLDQLRKRVVELEAQMKQLDEDFKAGRINGDEYAEQRVRLKQIRA